MRRWRISSRQTTALVAAAAVILGAGLADLRIRSTGGHHPAHHHTAVAVSGESAGAAALSPTTTTTPVLQARLATLGPDTKAVAYAQGPSEAIYTSPGAPSPEQTLSNPNSLGAPLVFLVVSAQGNWLQVMLPERPNGSTGWIQGSTVKLYSDDYLVVVHLGTYQLDLFRKGTLVETFPVAVGDSASPTPTGDFYITELLSTDPDGAYGPYAFGLSGFSDTYTEFDGGPGQVAIHGTDEPWLIGTSASHGCVRLDNTQLVQLVHVLPVGTPVDIVD